MQLNTSKNKIKKPFSDQAFNTVLMIIATVVLILVLYPMIYVLSSSFSSGYAITSGRVYLWPVDFSIQGYKKVFADPSIWRGYANTIYYVIGGTLVSLIMTICGAYPLSRKNYQAKPFVEKFLTASMLLGGGLIPTFIVVSNLGLVDTQLYMIISGVVGISWIIIMRTFFQNNVPYELLESAKMDGITDIGYLLKVTLPLSKAVISVICLYAVVGKWNSYMTPMIYLTTPDYYPLQIILKDLLLESQSIGQGAAAADSAEIAKAQEYADTIRYALIVVSIVPMLILYPFIQKFFEKGVTMGSVKG